MSQTAPQKERYVMTEVLSFNSVQSPGCTLPLTVRVTSALTFFATGRRCAALDVHLKVRTGAAVIGEDLPEWVAVEEELRWGPWTEEVAASGWGGGHHEKEVEVALLRAH